ncbi:hypothetical protein CEP53_008465, partial [Fusarium sp. AF-6]
PFKPHPRSALSGLASTAPADTEIVSNPSFQVTHSPSLRPSPRCLAPAARNTFIHKRQMAPPNMDFTLDPPDSGSPSWASSTPRPGRLQFWVDMANGPGFDVGSPEPESHPPDEKAVDAMARHPTSPSAHSAIFSTSELSSSKKPPVEQDPQSPAKIPPRTSPSATAETPPLQVFRSNEHLHLIHNGPYSCFIPSLKNLRVDGNLAIKNAGLQWAGDPAYQAHLWECYLTWVNPLTSLVERGLFDKDKECFLSSQESDFYSPALENAIFSAGAMHTTRQNPSIMGDTCKFFASRAKVYLDLELQTPTIATLQTLVLLCEHEAAQGWIYSGIATRILSDLGLQLHGTSPDETENRGADVAGPGLLVGCPSRHVSPAVPVPAVVLTEKTGFGQVGAEDPSPFQRGTFSLAKLPLWDAQMPQAPILEATCTFIWPRW